MDILKTYLEESEDRLLSPLVYAYIGDAVYELFVRNKIVAENPDLTPYLYYLRTTMYVKASSQAMAIKKIYEELDEDEKRIVKRGRNAKPKTIPKNAKLSDYKYATALEALIGYLYLENNIERLNYILSQTYNIITEECSNAKNNY
ncbi:ribonuclease-3 family protein [Caldicellulosiruptor bescii]|uniref:Mini-ribonuclease 3 n=2 Tax=Caldicellulosiruptor bescii TaxID=31899 RepID=B9MLD6_CALBD|nr:ribonuclease III domain-containing protein [Caldicellulosiruptor bescii]ACM61126.1 ribonuclease III [Caldicellulosiruptor bescii DSM 6725]PBC89061.1 ribonuclease-3 family protein [Caldicellulosiruptor bescii]PBC91457.1 ribonuclease-3 family protein [Caldicellulosiruptor bescii]PBD03132.1 ribonuclease-3 family protein [Caldicellulosiruptor bescii]PBD07255.1 ribonuclease-3 family protein [Caldicellulosiruptor bescii]